MIIPDEKFIAQNYEKTISLLDKFDLLDVKKLIEHFSEEYAIAPASYKQDYYSAFPGGLCYHNLHVLQWLGRFAGAMNLNSDKASLIKVAILHDIGKVGEDSNPYFVRTTESWKEMRGIYYDISETTKFLRMPQRSLYLAQQFNVLLTKDEYTSILLCDGQVDEANAAYKYKEPKLAIALHYAVYWARKVESEQKVQFP